MVRPSPEELRAQAFALSKILSGFKVKLSSQQCLDVLARLTWNSPYEAVLAGYAETPQAPNASYLKQWLSGAHRFCRIVGALDREGVQAAAWNGQAMPEGLHWAGRQYLKAAGAAALAFSAQARGFVEREIASFPSAARLSFRVEQSEPIVDEQLALLRIQNLDGQEEKEDPRRPRVSGIDWNRHAEPMLFGAEGRIELALEYDRAADGNYRLHPAVLAVYEVCGQNALEIFGEVVQESNLAQAWSMLPMQVATRILLTSDSGQDAIDEDFSTKSRGAKDRVIKFCERASKLGDDETRDWPPYLRLTKRLGDTSEESDLRVAFFSLCMHVSTIRGDSGGWYEILKKAKPDAEAGLL